MPEEDKESRTQYFARWTKRINFLFLIILIIAVGIAIFILRGR